MAEKKPQIVIKKITVVNGGGHGGAWKVAFADFMTALMAFFLVMWLLASSSEAQKKAVSDYFSTPSMIEYQFNNYGAELTLEKLFLDLVNEPLKTIQTFVQPVDRTPNMMAMGMKKVVMSFMADQLGTMASNVNVTADTVTFEIPDHHLFKRGTSDPAQEFVNIMERVKGVTQGLEDSDVILTTVVFGTNNDEPKELKNIAQERLDLIEAKVKGSLENDSVDVKGKALAKFDNRSAREKKVNGGYLRIEIKQKETLTDGRKPRKLSNGIFSGEDDEKSVYDSFVSKVSKTQKRTPQSAKKRAQSAE